MKKTNEGLMTRIRNVVAKDGGFTLIEVLAVMVIVGLLAAIAIPQISKWREKAHITAMKTDARSLSQAIEAFYVDQQQYPNTVTGASGTTSFTLTKTGTPAVTETITKNSATAVSYTYGAESFSFSITSNKAPGKTVSYNSATGGLTGP